MKLGAASTLTRELVRIPGESSDLVITEHDAPERWVAERLGAACWDIAIPHRLDEISPSRWNVIARLPRSGASRCSSLGAVRRRPICPHGYAR